MPKSKGRDKEPKAQVQRAAPVQLGPNPPWFVPLMVGLMVAGLLWTVTFYITNQRFPVPSLGQWNLGVGFGLMLAGFVMTTRWR